MENRNRKRRVLFYRELKGPRGGSNGGNLKMRDYFNHISSSSLYNAVIHFSPDTMWSDFPGNYWSDLRKEALSEFKLQSDDILLLAGTDWKILSEPDRRNPPIPILNVVHPRHTRPCDPRQKFLEYPAIRIAKSRHGADILEDYGVNGPLYVIPDAIDESPFLDLPDKDIDVLIVGLKQPRLAREVSLKLHACLDQLNGVVSIHTQLPPKLNTRLEFLKLLKRSKLIVCLPLSEERGFEGFYLPALEAMAARSLVVCPAAVGNLSHCIDGYNCIMPVYNLEQITNSIIKIWNLSDVNKEQLIRNGLHTVQKHTLAKERASILSLLKEVDDLWSEHFGEWSFRK